MKDHEIIAILEGCDEEQRGRIMTWARKRWPSPKKAGKGVHSQPAQPKPDVEALKKFLEEIGRAPSPSPPQWPPQWPPHPIIPERRQVDWGDPTLRYPIICGDASTETIISGFPIKATAATDATNWRLVLQ